jgi:phosphopantetheinyl transferase
VVDVWRVDLSRSTDDGLAELLCAREQERAGRIVDARRRALWGRSRGVLRMLLGRYLDTDPRALRFVLGDHGKPRLGSERPETWRESGSGSGEDLRFNLSHSGELMLLAVTAGREVGVDVERAGERYTAEFLRAWTVREATVKCLGTGLTEKSVTTEEKTMPRLWTAGLDAGPGAIAAVVVEGSEACELRRREAPPKLEE